MRLEEHTRMRLGACELPSPLANPYDNTSCESFMKTLKREEIYANDYHGITKPNAYRSVRFPGVDCT